MNDTTAILAPADQAMEAFRLKEGLQVGHVVNENLLIHTPWHTIIIQYVGNFNYKVGLLGAGLSPNFILVEYDEMESLVNFYKKILTKEQ